MPRRCDWALRTQIEQDYHDTQWGVPVHDDQALFRMLVLEGMQAGLSWLTILKKLDAFDAAFDGFDPQIMAGYDERKERALLQDSGIIRNRLKIQSLAINARAFLQVQAAFGSFNHYLWRFVHFRPIVNSWRDKSEVPARTALSDEISRDLKKRGFKFVGSTIVYAYMQSIGMVNDHLLDCDFRHRPPGEGDEDGTAAGLRGAVQGQE